MTFWAQLKRRLKPCGKNWAGLGFIALCVIVLYEAPYVNWHPIASPVDTDPLVLRRDAKGDGAFGAPRSGGRLHRGIDIMAAHGSPVRAIRSGRVITADTHSGLGHYVKIAHRGDITSLYAHLDEVYVVSGQRIRQGQGIGAVGNTGNAKHRLIEPHVHLEVARGEKRIDPAEFGIEVELRR